MLTTGKFVRLNGSLRLGLLIAAIVVAGSAGLERARADTYSGISIQSTAGGQVACQASDDVDSQTHALVFLANGALVDLNPAGYLSSQAFATNGTQQVGLAWTPFTLSTPSTPHAVLWSGSAGSVVDLQPVTGYDLAGIGTRALGISPNGAQQVGTGAGSNTSFRNHALLWSGNTVPVVDLNPAGITNSVAYGTDGTHQVGTGDGHAILWSGSAASAVNLQPTNLTGFFGDIAYGVSGTQQVGDGTYGVGGYLHALLWTGAANSTVDLSPPADQFNNSIAYSTNGTKQVGYEDFGVAYKHAMVWSGTPDSEVDLNALLPADGEWTSVAYNIDLAGNIFGWANGTLNGVIGDYAIEWSPTSIAAPFDGLAAPGLAPVDPGYTATVLYDVASPVPEPASIGVLAVGILALVARRRR